MTTPKATAPSSRHTGKPNTEDALIFLKPRWGVKSVHQAIAREPLFFAPKFATSEAADVFNGRTGRSERFEPRPATTPTQSKPGSPERIRVYQERLARGESLFHDQDRRIKHRPSLPISTLEAMRYQSQVNDAALDHQERDRRQLLGRNAFQEHRRNRPRMTQAEARAFVREKHGMLRGFDPTRQNAREAPQGRSTPHREHATR